MNTLEGFFLLDKPAGLTSFDCIENNLKVLMGKECRIGYAGTLDAFATGLLIIAFGRAATVHIDMIMTLDKRYWARAKWGEQTDTLEVTGAVINTDQTPLNETLLYNALVSFEKGYFQTPPLFSALKYKGRRLSDLVRRNTVDESVLVALAKSKARYIDIYQLRLSVKDKSFFSMDAHVSHGTYIRSLVRDIAHKAGGYATTHELRRLQVGPLRVEDALSLLQIKNKEDIVNRLIPVDVMIRLIKDYNLTLIKQKQFYNYQQFLARKKPALIRKDPALIT